MSRLIFNMRVLICGGRDYADYGRVREVLSGLQITSIIHGRARGADLLGGRYAEENQISCSEFPADWEQYGKRAGVVRNRRMLEEGKPDVIIAFPGGKGTQHMIKIAKEAGVPVKEIS